MPCALKNNNLVKFEQKRKLEMNYNTCYTWLRNRNKQGKKMNQRDILKKIVIYCCH